MTSPSHFKQCFWHATGELVCEHTVVSTPIRTQQNYQTFSTPQPTYNPNAYLQNVDWYNKAQTPQCNVPCNSCTAPPQPSNQSPPRDYTKTQ